jgi:hypothetical protein
VPEEVLMDNPRALVVRHDAASRQVQFNVIGAIAEFERSIRHGVREVAVHTQVQRHRQRIIDRAHLDGVAGCGAAVRRQGVEASLILPPAPALLRPLSEYEAVIGGSF